jgi:hypothetical protein
LTVRGKASADTLGVARVTVAVSRRSSTGRCAWYSAAKKRFVAGSCTRPRYVRAAGTKRWHLKLRASAMRSGGYRIYSRATQKRSHLTERRKRARVSFSVSR